MDHIYEHFKDFWKNFEIRWSCSIRNSQSFSWVDYSFNQGLKKSSASCERKFPRATFLANPWPYSSFNLAEMVLNPTLTPSTHSKIHPIKYQASNIEHCMINKNCRYIWSKLKLRKARNYPEIGWVKKGLYRAQFTNVKFAVHDKRH